MWNTIEWWEDLSEKRDEFGDLIFERTGKNLPSMENIEYIICLDNGDHYIAQYFSGWFYVEGLPALYPVAWMFLQEYISK